MSPPIKRYVIWSDKEKDTVALHTAVLLRRQSIHKVPDLDDYEGSRFLLDAIRQAQGSSLEASRRRTLHTGRNALKEDFWRRLNGFIRMPVTNAELEAKLVTLRNGTEAPPSAPPQAPTAPAAAPEPRVVRDGENHQQVVEVPELKEHSVHELVDALLAKLGQNQTFVQRFTEVEASLKSVAEKIAELAGFDTLITEEMSQLKDQLGQQSASLMRRMTELEHNREVRSNLTKVAIIGCRKDEFDAVVREAGDLPVDLKLYDQEEQPRTIHAEWAVIMKWANHKWTDQVKANIPHGQWTFIRGGTGQVAAQLKTWFGS
jgi:hypothetical protein